MIRGLAGLALFALAVAGGGWGHALAQVALVATWALAGLGLVLVVGQTGQLSLGHGAMLALGAYVQAGLVAAGLPALLALPVAAAAGAALGLLASLPGRRLGGLAFGMSTLAFALIVEELLVRLAPWTGGAAGQVVPAFTVGPWRLSSPVAQAALSVAVLTLAWLACRRLIGSALGRAWRASRDNEAAAMAIGVDVGAVRQAAFVAGGALGALAGALSAHWLGYLSPEQFGLGLSFELLMMVFVGGVRTPSGALLGGVVMVALPQLIAIARGALPVLGGGAAGLEVLLFGAVLVVIVLARPAGLAGDGR
ncbi:MAG: branched-chain amino acid ABC transporter permease [Rhodocyclaceae bacterium]|nr:branched-chain amino acid ABC transporter permease [Rhodocyclaceae bacterium]